MARPKGSKNNDKSKTVERLPSFEPPAISPQMAAVQAGQTLVHTRNSILEMVKVMKPRNEAEVLSKSLTELSMSPELAEQNYYVIPHKDKFNKVVNVEGPSIKAAMSLARRWGNSASEGVIISEDDDYYIVEGRFVDAETSFLCARQVKVSKFYIPRETKIKTPLRDDRLTMAVQAGLSKAVRNSILAGLPAYLVAEYFKAAKKLASGGQLKKPSDIDSIAQRMYATFGEMGVTKKMLDAYIEDKGGLTQDVIGTLKGIYNAIKDGQTTVGEVFGAISDESAKTPQQGEVTPGQLL